MNNVDLVIEMITDYDLIWEQGFLRQLMEEQPSQLILTERLTEFATELFSRWNRIIEEFGYETIEQAVVYLALKEE